MSRELKEDRHIPASFSIPLSYVERINALVRSKRGKYPTPSAVVQEALKLLFEREGV